MTWRKAMNRRRAARLAQELPAVARPSEGEGVSTPSRRFLPNLVGAAKAAAPATFSEGTKKKGRKTHVISKEELAPLVAQGLNDVKIGKLYGHSASWTPALAQHLRDQAGMRSRWLCHRCAAPGEAASAAEDRCSTGAAAGPQADARGNARSPLRGLLRRARRLPILHRARHHDDRARQAIRRAGQAARPQRHGSFLRRSRAGSAARIEHPR